MATELSALGAAIVAEFTSALANPRVAPRIAITQHSSAVGDHPTYTCEYAGLSFVAAKFVRTDFIGAHPYVTRRITLDVTDAEGEQIVFTNVAETLYDSVASAHSGQLENAQVAALAALRNAGRPGLI